MKFVTYIYYTLQMLPLPTLWSAPTSLMLHFLGAYSMHCYTLMLSFIWSILVFSIAMPFVA